ncbi:hypothetical protein [Halomarina oriensis]|uniref:Uncharacterized protein n=1 Tax=Halomarina oriensis TaxID=671145 RepID=A0A6B0GQV5_9EURY|nr:hypothetical protein [Halomarina oriensis]MWG36461.1 hypothetical protein [Halomarina oriensis]
MTDDLPDLLVGCSAPRDEVAARIADTDATLRERVGRATLLVEATPEQADHIAALDGVVGTERNYRDVKLLVD